VRRAARKRRQGRQAAGHCASSSAMGGGRPGWPCRPPQKAIARPPPSRALQPPWRHASGLATSYCERTARRVGVVVRHAGVPGSRCPPGRSGRRRSPGRRTAPPMAGGRRRPRAREPRRSSRLPGSTTRLAICWDSTEAGPVDSRLWRTDSPRGRRPGVDLVGPPVGPARAHAATASEAARRSAAWRPWRLHPEAGRWHVVLPAKGAPALRSRRRPCAVRQRPSPAGLGTDQDVWPLEVQQAPWVFGRSLREAAETREVLTIRGTSPQSSEGRKCRSGGNLPPGT